ncbi:hypothetical protein KFE25_000526 [Diacronema lutheri]|uniref:Uncharacterized protein n=1 Tax=Diacronema lutheri TaxID=2081491 RepID=A0A7R9UKN4_DIALT|nr:hypothetical protein KFE25_000526 [Diacronema lutheri]|mmetsp:Transcript_1221/g.3994  ORF Transcript_1221/g.3994 Transcript_1221/m.3994 type:complete len:321 (+) Transcript_1221:2-964(+)
MVPVALVLHFVITFTSPHRSVPIGARCAPAARVHVEASVGRLVRNTIYVGFAVAAGTSAVSVVQELASAAQGGAEASELVKSATGLGVDMAVLATVATSYTIDQRAASRPVESRARAPKPQLASALTDLRELPLTIRAPEPSADDERPTLVERQVLLRVLQEDAKQAVVLVVGCARAVDDILLSAIVQSGSFVPANVLLVPVVYGAAADGDGAEATPREPKGFAKPGRRRSAQQPYVANPIDGEGGRWSRALDAEVAAAREQGARAAVPFDPLERGLLFVLGPEQKVLQRRLGRPSWDDFIEEIAREAAGAAAPLGGSPS